MNDEPAYVVEPVEAGYEVRSQDGRVIIGCRDESSARHYAVMLEAAFSAGFKRGYQEGVSER
jgi:hypothetical protein